MKKLEEIAMMIITNSGVSKSFTMEALDKAKEKDYEAVEELFKKAEEALRLASQEHFKALKEDMEKGIDVNILMLHAEDQMMSSETILTLSKKIVELTK